MSNGDEAAFPDNDGLPKYKVIDMGDKGTILSRVFVGLTKRELLAGMAMQGILAGRHWNSVDIYRDSVYHADALLAELAKAKEAPNASE